MAHTADRTSAAGCSNWILSETHAPRTQRCSIASIAHTAAPPHLIDAPNTNEEVIDYNNVEINTQNKQGHRMVSTETQTHIMRIIKC